VTISRAKLINPEVTRWYHCISRCVRRAYLFGEGNEDAAGLNRKAWMEERLRFLNSLFAVSVAGFAVLDNHLHTLVRMDLADAKQWSPSEVVRRWLVLFPPRDRKRLPIKVTPELIESKIQDSAYVEEIRNRLSSISWFMKCLKEPLARLANKADDCKGTFFEGRFKSIAILDEESLLTVCAYIDLNPVAAGIAEAPEESQHTSIKERVDHVASQGRIDDLRVAKRGSVAAIKAACHLEEGLWLIPIEDRRAIDSKREGMLSGFTLGNYLMLLEYTGRIVRTGKVSISPEILDIFDRIGTTSQRWQNRVKKMIANRWYGSFIASSRQLLIETANKLGLHHLANAVN
jgi:REP element-mobilizing transposase RayT